MVLRKDRGTGWWNIFYWVPVRTKRRKYRKTPVVGCESAFTRFARDLFRGGPNPFLASPMATKIDRRIKIERQGRAAKRRGDDGSANELISQVDAELDRYLRTCSDTADEILDDLEVETNEEETLLENCRPRVIKADLAGELDEVIRDVDLHFGPTADALDNQRKDAQKFFEDHELTTKKDLHIGKALSRDSMYFLAAVTFVELVLNAAFFSGTQRTGLIGGAALAALLSIATIVLGVFFGWAYQYSDRRVSGNGWRGRIGLVLLLLAAAFYLSLLTLARRAGEAGDINMFETAAREVAVRPFSGLLDLPALVYCFFTIGVIVWVAWKFVNTMGNFPQIRSHKLGVVAAEHDVNDVRIGMVESLEARVRTQIEKLDAVPDIIQARKLAIKEICIDYENVIDQFKNDVEEIKDADRLLVAVIKRYLGSASCDQSVEIDYATRVGHFDARLAEFRIRTGKLLHLEEVSAASIERYREEMTELGKRKRKELERCLNVRSKPSAPKPGGPKPAPTTDHDNVAWLFGEPAT